MTPKQITLVKDSWAKVLPIKEITAQLFYNRLFEEYPEVKSYFKSDLEKQGKKLITMINTVVSTLDNIDVLAEPIKELGKRHSEYGIQLEDYDKVGDCLLWTLEHGLQDAFTPDVKDAWLVVYSAIAEIMIDGANYLVAKSA